MNNLLEIALSIAQDYISELKDQIRDLKAKIYALEQIEFDKPHVALDNEYLEILVKAYWLETSKVYNYPKVNCIKMYRSLTNQGLRESKDYVESVMSKYNLE